MVYYPVKNSVCACPPPAPWPTAPQLLYKLLEENLLEKRDYTYDQEIKIKTS